MGIWTKVGQLGIWTTVIQNQTTKTINRETTTKKAITFLTKTSSPKRTSNKPKGQQIKHQEAHADLGDAKLSNHKIEIYLSKISQHQRKQSRRPPASERQRAQPCGHHAQERFLQMKGLNQQDHLKPKGPRRPHEQPE